MDRETSRRSTVTPQACTWMDGQQTIARRGGDGDASGNLQRKNPGQSCIGCWAESRLWTHDDANHPRGPPWRLGALTLTVFGAVKGRSVESLLAKERFFASEFENVKGLPWNFDCSSLAERATEPLAVGTEAVGLPILQIPTGSVVPHNRNRRLHVTSAGYCSMRSWYAGLRQRENGHCECRDDRTGVQSWFRGRRDLFGPSRGGVMRSGGELLEVQEQRSTGRGKRGLKRLPSDRWMMVTRRP